jgi:sigma-B regulation protein RsbU (phosphoserine phosphatase)
VFTSALLHEIRTRRMARFVLGVILLGIALVLLDRAISVPSALWLIFWPALLISAFYYIARLVSFVRDRLLWPLRRRLIVTYVFIAVIPILLILLLVAIGGLILNAQFAAFLVAENIQDRVEKLQQLSRGVAQEANLSTESKPTVLLDRIQRNFVTQLLWHGADYPALEITLRLGNEVRAFNSSGPLPKPVEIPAWLKPTTDEYSGTVIEGGRLIIRSLVQASTPHGQFALILSEPITPELLDQIGAGIGPVGVGVIGPAAGESSTSPQSFDESSRMARESSIVSRNVAVPPPAFFGDYTVFGAFTLDPIVWGGNEKTLPGAPVFLYVTSRVMTLEAKLLSTLGRFSRVYAVAFVAVGVVFLVLEILAFMVGVRLTRSVTTTVDELYSATERVRAGDFSHRIQLPARDQLTALGEAFDSMTASVERLLRESQEKLRLESELEIAREVQSRLFPRTFPQVRGLELFGKCYPARSVSGDYYDFVTLDANRVALVLGDIAGKGISAALLMAAIQSSLRAQLFHSPGRDAQEGLRPISTSEIVKRLNQQLFESTSAEKYATFFYAVYDGATRQLSYTNAGHLPPVVFRRKGIERLDKGGTVVGIFPDAEYAEATIGLEPGDVFLAFTDGLTEPENNYDEDFGEERLIETVARSLQSPLDQLTQRAFDALNDWTGSPELHDDMTLVVARCVGGEK